MLQNVINYIVTSCPTKPIEPYATTRWREEISEAFAAIPEEHEEIHTLASSLTEIMLRFYEKAVIAEKHKNSETDLVGRIKHLSILSATVQTVQRSPEWYKQFADILSGSQFPTIFAHGTVARAKLVMSKANTEVTPPTTNRLAAWSHETNPFDWGIRFEPVAKAIYEAVTHTSVREIGRLVHRNPLLKLAASPDGIVESGDPDRIGCFVEFKSPITRHIGNGEVVPDYWKQTQIQMEVGDVNKNDYFEVQIRSVKGESIQGPCRFFGKVYTIGAPMPPYEDPQPVRYLYSPIGGELSEEDIKAMISPTECLLETLEWGLLGYNLVTVPRSRHWFETVAVPEIIKFWEDVESAKRGEFAIENKNTVGKKRVRRGTQPNFQIYMLQDDNDTMGAKKEPVEPVEPATMMDLE